LYIIIPDKLVPFDAKQHTQIPVVECIDPTCICPFYITLYNYSVSSLCYLLVDVT